MAMILLPFGSSESERLCLHFLKISDSNEAVGIIIHNGFSEKNLASGSSLIVSINKNHKLTVVL